MKQWKIFDTDKKNRRANIQVIHIQSGGRGKKTYTAVTKLMGYMITDLRHYVSQFRSESDTHKDNKFVKQCE